MYYQVEDMEEDPLGFSTSVIQGNVFYSPELHTPTPVVRAVKDPGLPLGRGISWPRKAFTTT